MKPEEFDLEEFKKPWTFKCKHFVSGKATEYKLEPELASFILKNICVRLAQPNTNNISKEEVQRLIVGAWIATYQNPKNVDFGDKT